MDWLKKYRIEQKLLDSSNPFETRCIPFVSSSDAYLSKVFVLNISLLLK